MVTHITMFKIEHLYYVHYVIFVGVKYYNLAHKLDYNERKNA